jgi:hypothetical protein
LEYLIDIVGTCNLKCPSCPVGNFTNADYTDVKRAKGFMEYDLFEQVVTKAESDSAARGEPLSVFLYNWGEALIHPRIVDIVDLLSRKKIPFHISTNMNNEAPLKKIVRAGPASFRISLSGFSQQTYQRGHVGGDTHLVISNMYRLRHAMDHCGSNMPVEVYYHVYRDNCDEDLAAMVQLCNSLGFRFRPGWASYMGLEKVLAHVEGTPRWTPSDEAVLDRTVLTLDEALAIAQQASSPQCRLQLAQTVINHDGSVPLCCSVYDPANNVASDFLSISDAELQAKRAAAALCERCMSHAIHDYSMNNPNQLWDHYGRERQAELGQRYITSTYAVPHVLERRETKISRIRRNVARVINIKVQ